MRPIEEESKNEMPKSLSLDQSLTGKSYEMNKSMKPMTPVKKKKTFTPVKVLSKANFQSNNPKQDLPSDAPENKHTSAYQPKQTRP